MAKSRLPGVFGSEPASGPTGAPAAYATPTGPVGARTARLDIRAASARWAVGGPAAAEALPSDLVAIYRSLRVAYSDPASTGACETVADIHTYTNVHIARRCPNMDRKSELLGIVRRELRAPPERRRMLDAEDGDRLAIAHTFNGQGSPDEVRTTLRYALTFGLASPERLAHFCDEDPKVGLDCVGFVMNYFQHIGRLNERLSFIPSYAERGTPRTGIAQIQARDILIWDGTAIGHIAVVDAKDPGSDSMRVAESCGSRGLSVSEYVVQGVSDGLFTVRVTGGGTSTVRIYGMP